MIGAQTTGVASIRARHRSIKHPPVETEEGNSSAVLTAPFASECVMEPVTGTVILDKDMHRQWPTASLAKMMLTLIVAEKLHDGSLKLGDRVTTSRAASRLGGSQIYLKEGETLTLDDMMQAIVVHSANDASLAVAEYVAGSSEAFVGMMNAEAKRLGLADTHYYSVHGLPPDRDQQADVSSAYDLAMIARELVKYPNVLRWSAIDTSTLRGGAFVLRNTNHLVRTYPGCDGLKTGFYYKAGFNVVATAHRSGLRLIAVVLGSPRKNENFSLAAAAMSQGFADYQMREVAKQGTAIDRTVTINGGASSRLKPLWASSASIFVKRDAKVAYQIEYKLPASVSAPILSGQQVGTGLIVINGKVQQEVPLIAPSNIARGSLFQRLIGML
jgi:D-alanyl-D-alanine carboxypeptidase (penicillin-binding protein 5/6)